MCQSAIEMIIIDQNNAQHQTMYEAFRKAVPEARLSSLYPAHLSMQLQRQ